MRLVKVSNQPGLLRSPAQLLLRLRTGSWAVDTNEVREPAKVVGGLLGRFADNRYIQAAADYLSDFSEGHTLVGDAVIAGSRRTLLQCQPVACRVEQHRAGAPRASG